MIVYWMCTSIYVPLYTSGYGTGYVVRNGRAIIKYNSIRSSPFFFYLHQNRQRSSEMNVWSSSLSITSCVASSLGCTTR